MAHISFTNKAYFLSYLGIFLSLICSDNIICRSVYGQKIASTLPSEVVFAFDIHGVLADLSVNKICKQVGKMGFVQSCKAAGVLCTFYAQRCLKTKK